MLWRIWNYRCYWCGEPKDFTDTQIDHIIPRSIQLEELQRLAEDLALDWPYDVDAVGNLAPICGRCNGASGKSGKNHLRVPLVRDKLDQAITRRKRVVKQYRGFGSNSKLAENLLAVAQADLTTEEARRVFREIAPAIVQKLALLDDGEIRYTTFNSLGLMSSDGASYVLDVSLGESARRALVVLEDVCGGNLESIVPEPVAELFRQIASEVHGQIEATYDPFGPLVAGPPETTFERSQVNSVELSTTGGEFEFTFGGEFEVSLSASVVRDSLDEGLDELQGDAYVTGKFSFTATWRVADSPGELEMSEPWIDEIDAEVWTNG